MREERDCGAVGPRMDAAGMGGHSARFGKDARHLRPLAPTRRRGTMLDIPNALAIEAQSGLLTIPAGPRDKLSCVTIRENERNLRYGHHSLS